MTISCIPAYGGEPFVRSFQDSCNLGRVSCLFCEGMNGSCRDLLGTE